MLHHDTRLRRAFGGQVKYCLGCATEPGSCDPVRI